MVRECNNDFFSFFSDGVRKFRHLFLFNDYIICTKKKITARYVMAIDFGVGYSDSGLTCLRFQ